MHRGGDRQRHVPAEWRRREWGEAGQTTGRYSGPSSRAPEDRAGAVKAWERWIADLDYRDRKPERCGSQPFVPGSLDPREIASTSRARLEEEAARADPTGRSRAVERSAEQNQDQQRRDTRAPSRIARRPLEQTGFTGKGDALAQVTFANADQPRVDLTTAFRVLFSWWLSSPGAALAASRLGQLDQPGPRRWSPRGTNSWSRPIRRAPGLCRIVLHGPFGSERGLTPGQAPHGRNVRSDRQGIELTTYWPPGYRAFRSRRLPGPHR